MIIVTGTKRSGTSMWMQILAAAGLPIFGEAFPRNWETILRDANPAGFFESILRRGIYWRTNPHPKTGVYFFPEQVERHAVKVFIPGLVRTDRAYIGRVIASLRPWREYVRSLRRLWAMEDAARAEQHPDLPAPARLSPALEWWSENYMLLRDVATRRYSVHLQSYDGLLEDPRGVLTRTLEWLGHGELDAAVAAVDPQKRTQRAEPDESQEALDPDESLDPDLISVFDRLYETVHGGQPVTPDLLAALNATHQVLAPRILEQQRTVARAHQRLRAQRREPRVPLDDDEPDELEQPTW